MPRPASDREAIEDEIDRVRSLGLDELRTLWRTTFRSSPPPTFTKDLMARFLCWHIQERAFGGLDPEIANGTLSLSFQTAMSGTRRPMPASRPSPGPSPARGGMDRASLGYAAARSQGLRRKRPMCRGHQTTSDVLFGRPSRFRLAPHKDLSSVMGSADHEACRSQAWAHFLISSTYIKSSRRSTFLGARDHI
jgi:hypothetical protein